MKRINACPACGADAARSFPAIEAPFIAEWVLERPPARCRFMDCNACGLQFFDHRFEPHELQRLYGAYRGERYTAVRRRHEPWYTERFQRGLNEDDSVVESRRARLRELLRPHVDLTSVGRVLDFGGDRGQFIPPELGRERFVHELSDVAPVAGVHKLPRVEDLERGGYDLVILSNVLEHAPDPVALLGEVSALVRPGGHLFVDVPWEHVDTRFYVSAPWMERWLDALVTRTGALRAVDLYSTAFRVKLRTIPPLGFAKLHEHQNVFTAAALRAALATTPLTLATCRRDKDIVLAIAHA